MTAMSLRNAAQVYLMIKAAMFLSKHAPFNMKSVSASSDLLIHLHKLRPWGIHYTFVVCRCTGHKSVNKLPLSDGPIQADQHAQPAIK